MIHGIEQKFVVQTLEDGPSSSENEDVSPAVETSSLELHCQMPRSYRGHGSILADVTNISLSEESTREDVSSCYFPQTNHLDR